MLLRANDESMSAGATGISLVTARRAIRFHLKHAPPAPPQCVPDMPSIAAAGCVTFEMLCRRREAG